MSILINLTGKTQTNFGSQSSSIKRQAPNRNSSGKLVERKMCS
jgi:hypothetical protein